MLRFILRKRRKGFTLAELLIALAILGVIATFTIPKVLQVQQDQTRKAVFRETLGVLSEAIHVGLLTGDLKTGPWLVGDYAFYKARLNYLKYCVDCITEGYFPPAVGSCGDSKGFVLPNGAVITDFDGGYTNAQGGYWESVCIDYNGLGAPNTLGIDVLTVTLYYGKAPEAGNMPGSIKPLSGANTTLYNWIFSN